jgi:hypothetical protein
VVQVGGPGAGLGTSPEAARLGAVIELRVHGVSGTPPEQMLADPWAVRVAGDDLAGFYRRGQATSSPARAGAVVPEAFSWGSLTSGASARALWLLLLPFMLANVAYWMRPHRTGQLDRLARWLLRLLSISLTATMVLAAAGVCVDLVGWQCTEPGQPCGADRSWLRWLTTGFWADPGRRLVVCALGPAMLILLLWYLGRRTWTSYESVSAPGPVDRPDIPIADPTFWYGRHLVRRLRGLHLAAAMIALAGTLVTPALRADRLSDQPLLAAVGWALVAALLALTLAVILVLGARRVVDRSALPRQDRLHVVARLVAPISLLVTLLVAAYVAIPGRREWPNNAALPGHEELVTTQFSVQVGLLLMITGVVWAQRRLVPAGTALRGFAAPVTGALALVTACAFSAGVSFRAADFLDGAGTPAQPSATRASMLQPPPQYSWGGLGFLIVLAGLVLLLLITAATQLRGRALTAAEREYVAELRTAEPGLNPYQVDRLRLRRIARTRLAAAITDRLPGLLAALVLPGALIAILMTVTVVLTTDSPVMLVQRHVPSLASAASFATNLGTWLVSGFALALIILGRAAYRRPRLRRVVGILWDVGTFWPRGSHPLAPPCYSERAVPDLVRRASWLATPGLGRGDVLLSAHSQGTVLSAAALLQMPDQALDTIRLLSYGCPLHRLYQRYFPAYFDTATLTRLDDCLGERWTNLSRLTDPIGGPVFPNDPARHARIDRLLNDPVTFSCPPRDTVPPPIRMHSDYWADEAYEAAVQGLLARPVALPVEARPIVAPTLSEPADDPPEDAGLSIVDGPAAAREALPAPRPPASPASPAEPVPVPPPAPRPGAVPAAEPEAAPATGRQHRAPRSAGQPADGPPAGSQPGGSQPAGSQPAGSQPAGSQRAGRQPSGAEPARPAATGPTPAGPTPAGSTPAGSTPAGSTPAGSISSRPAGPRGAGGKAKAGGATKPAASTNGETPAPDGTRGAGDPAG